MDDHNDIFRLAAELVMYTSQNIFLTGKAGTGKTTFLHYIRQHSHKKVIVAAPTGVAAINAGGVTLHSLFQLPFEAFIPDFEGRRKLDYHFRVRKSKVEMFRELELLIIDEVSMLRSDTLDAIDITLKRFRGNSQPFGGVQLLFIGDLFQLPPVVHEEEWLRLKEYYKTPFFFEARILQNNQPISIELNKVYRQSEQLFVDILNRMRVNQITPQDLANLNRLYQPNFKLSGADKYIVLTTHNYRADRINNEQLERLTAKPIVLKGTVKGDFSDNSLPADKDLRLKVGAQVMFVKNDTQEKKRYYNGKLAEVTFVNTSSVFVRFEDGQEMEVEPETWKNIRYSLTESGDIEEQEIGSFSQYPLRLAWAITIHKSQGLTFDRVVIDAGQAFAAGQVYVAFSRCTSLDGIVLYSRIENQAISSNDEITAFSESSAAPSEIQQIIDREKPDFCRENLKKYFEWMPALKLVDTLRELIESKKLPNEEDAFAMTYQMRHVVMEEMHVADKFRNQLEQILRTPQPEDKLVDILKERVAKAVNYFKNDYCSKILYPFQSHLAELQHASKVKLYLKNAKKIYDSMNAFIARMDVVYYGELLLSPPSSQHQAPPGQKQEKDSQIAVSGKAKKGDSARLSLNLLKEGKRLTEIAQLRNLSITTIQSHLCEFIESEDVSIYHIVEREKADRLMALMQHIAPDMSITAMRQQLGDEFSYADIKAVLLYLRLEKK